MADLTITATNVVAPAGNNSEVRTALETIAAGEVVYLNPTTRQVGLADSNSATAHIRKVYGIALNGGALNQPISVLRSGPVTIGATMTAGVAYYLSDTPGGICPVADLGAGEYPVFLGFATSTTVLTLDVQTAGVAL